MLLRRIGDSLDIPLSVVLQWPSPNYDAPEQRTWLIPYSLTFGAVTTILVIVRLALRLAKKGGGLGLDDAFLIPSYIMLALHIAFSCWGVTSNTSGRHVYDIRPENYQIGAEIGWWLTIFFSGGTGLLKLSILFFYRRLIKGTYNRAWLIATWLAVGFTASYSIAFILGIVFTCWPIEAYWLAADPFWAATNNFRCYTWVWGNVLSGVFNAVSDLYSVILPGLVLWNLHLPRRQKIGLFAIFTLGGLDVILACVRTKYMIDFAVLYDPSWYGFDATAVSIAEWNVGMICACLPSLRVLFRTFFDYGQQDDRLRTPPRYMKPRSLNRIGSTESVLPLAECKGEPQWLEASHIENAPTQTKPKGILRVRDYAVA